MPPRDGELSDLTDVLSTVPDPAVAHDPASGDIVAANESFCERYGGSVGSPPSLESVAAGIPPYTAVEARTHVTALDPDESTTFEWLADGPGEGYRWVEVRLKHVSRGSDGVVVASARDVGDRKSRETELQRRSDRLATLAEVAGDLQDAGAPREVYADLAGGVQTLVDAAGTEVWRTDKEAPAPKDLDRVTAVGDPIEGAPGVAAGVFGDQMATGTVDIVDGDGASALVSPVDDHHAIVASGVDGDAFEADDEWLVAVLATQAGAVLARLQVDQPLETRADGVEAMLTAFPDYAFLYDAEGTYLDVFLGQEPDDPARQQFTREELVGQHVEDFLGPSAAETIREGLSEAITEDVWTRVEYSIRPGSETRWYEGRIVPLSEPVDGREAAVLVAREVTQRRAYREELERTNERLEDLAGVVSHDLRNPLNAALGHVDLARTGDAEEHLETVETSLRRMDDIIEDLLTLAREGEHESTYEAVDLAALARQAWQAVVDDGISLEVADPGSAMADPGQLARLLENLFRNAVEHGGEDVTVTVGALDDGAGFYVADDGVGIPADRRQSVFESGHTTTAGGTGLGLTIVESIADNQGWSVTLTESATGGARFEFTGVDRPE